MKLLKSNLKSHLTIDIEIIIPANEARIATQKYIFSNNNFFTPSMKK
jgi:hypothetical protein